MSKLFFLVCIELPTEPLADHVEILREEIGAHAEAVVPFFTHQQPVRKTACVRIDPPHDLNLTVAMASTS